MESSPHLLPPPSSSPEETGQKADFVPLIIQSNPGLWLYTLSKERYVWKYLCFFGGPDILCLGPQMLVSACQYNSLVDPAINEDKSISDSKKGMTGNLYIPLPFHPFCPSLYPPPPLLRKMTKEWNICHTLGNLLTSLHSKPSELAGNTCIS